MENTKQLHLVDEWYVGALESNIVLYRKMISGASGKKTKNVGTEYFDAVGYFSSIPGLCKGLYKKLTIEAIMDPNVKTLSELRAYLEDKISRIEKIDEDALMKMYRRAKGEDDE